jgi:hypothetical protein
LISKITEDKLSTTSGTSKVVVGAESDLSIVNLNERGPPGSKKRKPEVGESTAPLEMSKRQRKREREKEKRRENRKKKLALLIIAKNQGKKRGKQGRRRRAKRTVNNGLVEQDTTRLDGDLEAHLKEECPSLPVHNFSNRCFAPVVLAVLGLGLKFVPKALLRTREVEEEINRALDGLKRRLDLAFWFEDELETDPFIPPITSKRKWSPPAPGE